MTLPGLDSTKTEVCERTKKNSQPSNQQPASGVEIQAVQLMGMTTMIKMLPFLTHAVGKTLHRLKAVTDGGCSSPPLRHLLLILRCQTTFGGHDLFFLNQPCMPLTHPASILPCYSGWLKPREKKRIFLSGRSFETDVVWLTMTLNLLFLFHTQFSFRNKLTVTNL